MWLTENKGLIEILKNGMCGFINRSGKIIKKPIYKESDYKNYLRDPMFTHLFVGNDYEVFDIKTNETIAKINTGGIEVFYNEGVFNFGSGAKLDAYGNFYNPPDPPKKTIYYYKK